MDYRYRNHPPRHETMHVPHKKLILQEVPATIDTNNVKIVENHPLSFKTVDSKPMQIHPDVSGGAADLTKSKVGQVETIDSHFIAEQMTSLESASTPLESVPAPLESVPVSLESKEAIIPSFPLDDPTPVTKPEILKMNEPDALKSNESETIKADDSEVLKLDELVDATFEDVDEDFAKEEKPTEKKDDKKKSSKLGSLFDRKKK